MQRLGRGVSPGRRGTRLRRGAPGPAGGVDIRFGSERAGPFERDVADRSAADAQRDDDRQGEIELAVIDRPAVRGPQVPDLGAEAFDPRQLLGSPQTGACLFGERRVVHGVPTLQCLRRSRVLEVLMRVLTYGFEQAVAGTPVRLVGQYERTPDQRAEVLDHVDLVDRVARHHCLGVVEAGAPRRPTTDRARVARRRSGGRTTNRWCAATFDGVPLHRGCHRATTGTGHRAALRSPAVTSPAPELPPARSRAECHRVGGRSAQSLPRCHRAKRTRYVRRVLVPRTGVPRRLRRPHRQSRPHSGLPMT